MSISQRTPFRERFERACQLDLVQQIEECVDYLQNPAVLVSEFCEAYYQVEGKLDPEREDHELENLSDEIVLEPFFDSMELVVQAGSKRERIRCLAGAFAPLAGEMHPALEHRGVDFIGVREGTSRVVLGVNDASEEASPFPLLLRGLNCLAELTPPFQLTRLRRHVLRERLDPEARFDLQLGLPLVDSSPDRTTLMLLTRDLAEVWKREIGAHHQFSGTVGRIECVEALPNPGEAPLRVRWRA